MRSTCPARLRLSARATARNTFRSSQSAIPPLSLFAKYARRICKYAKRF
jgi:hypothetical protein